MKVIAVNAGSSSLKFQLLEMPKETMICSGVVERIGLKDSIFTIKYGDQRQVEIIDIESHKVAVEKLLEKLVDLDIVQSLEDIQGVGHRVVHGGEKFKDSVAISKEVIDAIDEVSELAPLHNPANLTGIRDRKSVV